MADSKARVGRIQDGPRTSCGARKCSKKQNDGRVRGAQKQWRALPWPELKQFEQHNSVVSLMISILRDSLCKMGFHSGIVLKNLPAVQATGLGRSPGEGSGSPLQRSCLEDHTDRGRYSPWGRKEPDATQPPNNNKA